MSKNYGSFQISLFYEGKTELHGTVFFVILRPKSKMLCTWPMAKHVQICTDIWDLPTPDQAIYTLTKFTIDQSTLRYHYKNTVPTVHHPMKLRLTTTLRTSLDAQLLSEPYF